MTNRPDDRDARGTTRESDDLQRALDAASNEPRTGTAPGEDAGGDATEAPHPAPARQRPHPDNTDVRG